jgi:general secretion pathway protein K
MIRTPHHKSRRAQRGATLVVALLIVAMVVMLGTALSSDFLLMFRRVENQLYSEQAYAYLQGAEELARAALLQDLQRDGDKHNDNLAEPWAQEQQFPTDYGFIVGQIEDLGGRFNVNSLGSVTQGTADGGHSPAQNQFIRLLLTLKLAEPLALDQVQALTEAITDWIDGDEEVNGLGGAESQYYAQAEPMGRPPNHALASPSELMWVKGMTPEIYRALAPLITVWPTTGSMPVNLNTAPEQVLRSLGNPKETEPLSDSEVELLLQERTKPKYILNTDIISQGVLAAKHIEPATVSVASNDYFMLHTTTEFQGNRYSLESLLRRRNDKKPARVDVVARTYGEW